MAASRAAQMLDQVPLVEAAVANAREAVGDPRACQLVRCGEGHTNPLAASACDTLVLSSRAPRAPASSISAGDSTFPTCLFCVCDVLSTPATHAPASMFRAGRVTI